MTRVYTAGAGGEPDRLKAELRTGAEAADWLDARGGEPDRLKAELRTGAEAADWLDARGGEPDP